MVDIKRVGVIGAGTMGSGIAIVVSQGGFPTHIHDISPQDLADGLKRIGLFFDGGIRRKKITQEQRAEFINRIQPVGNLQELSTCQVVIEAISENIDIKCELFAKLNAICPGETIFVTNTSTLSVTAMARASGRPDRVVGMHFNNPAPLMRLVEVTRALQTSEETYQAAMDFAGRLGKIPVTTKDTPGFIVNYFLVPFENDCIRALEAGIAKAEDIDKAVKLGLGYPMGTFELLDVVGLDIHYQVSMSLYNQTKDTRFAPPPLVSKMIDAGYLGRKTGRGFYVYAQKGMFGA